MKFLVVSSNEKLVKGVVLSCGELGIDTVGLDPVGSAAWTVNGRLNMLDGLDVFNFVQATDVIFLSQTKDGWRIGMSPEESVKTYEENDLEWINRWAGLINLSSKQFFGISEMPALSTLPQIGWTIPDIVTKICKLSNLGY